MRQHRRDEQDQRAARLGTGRRGRCLLDLVRERMDLRDRLVEAERLDIGGDAGDRLMQLARERPVFAPVADVLGVAENPPQSLDEAPRATEARPAPHSETPRGGKKGWRKVE